MINYRFMQFIIDISNDTLLPFGGFLITIYVSFIWKKQNFQIYQKDIQTICSFIEKYINFSITYICPNTWKYFYFNIY